MYFWNDFAEYVYPAQVFALRALQNLELPFWNPYTFSGIPFMADVAVGVFYPPNWLPVLFMREGNVPSYAVQFVIIAHFALAQWTMFRFVRSLELSDLAALIAAISYGFSGMMVCHVFHPTMVAHYAWFPLVWMYFRQTLHELRLKPALQAGFVYGVMMLSGHPQTTLYAALLLFFFTLWTGVAQLWKKELRGVNILKFGALAALPVAIGAGIFAVQLLHSQEFSSVSQRKLLTMEQASLVSYYWKQLYSLLVPKFYGFVDGATIDSGASEIPYYIEGATFVYDYWETCFYVGVPTLMLAVIGWTHTLRGGFNDAQRHYLSGFLLFIAVFAVLFALGKNGWLFPLMFQLPLFDTFRIPPRMMMFAVLALCVMAAIGFDVLVASVRLQRDEQRSFVKTVGFVLIAFAALALFSGSGVLQTMVGTPSAVVSATQTQGMLALMYVLLAGALLMLLASSWMNVSVAGVGIVVLLFVDLNIAGSAFPAGRTKPEDQYRLAPALAKQLQAEPPERLFRVRTRERGAMTMSRNQGMITPIMMYEGYTPITLERSLPAARTADETYDLLNIRYEVRVDNERGLFFAERSSALPHLRMVYKIRQSSPEKAKETGSAPDFDIRNEVVLERPSPVVLSGVSAATVSYTARCNSYTANEAQYTISTPEAGIAVFSELWYPAWRVSIDGKPAESLRAQYCLRAVALPAGTHTVRWWYDSAAFRAGAWISATTLLGTVGCLIALAAVERKRLTSAR